MDGKLVGINAAIYSQSGGSLGIGFAVPSNMVRVVLNAVEQGKKSIVHPWLGIDGQEVTPELAASLNLPQPSGVLINQIHPASPAGKAGLHIGDLVVSVNGRTVEDIDAFRYRVATLPVGSTVDLGIIRKGQKLDIHVSLTAPPEDPPREKTSVTGPNPLAGAAIENISPAVIEETGLRGVEHGVVVASVKSGSNASHVGLHSSDVVISINGKKIGNVQEALAELGKSEDGWGITIQRGESMLTVMVGG
jgi:serine protease Do